MTSESFVPMLTKLDECIAHISVNVSKDFDQRKILTYKAHFMFLWFCCCLSGQNENLITNVQRWYEVFLFSFVLFEHADIKICVCLLGNQSNRNQCQLI